MNKELFCVEPWEVFVFDRIYLSINGLHPNVLPYGDEKLGMVNYKNTSDWYECKKKFELEVKFWTFKLKLRDSKS